MKTRLLRVFLLVVLIASLHGSALAQTYLFTVDQEVVNVFLNPDGTVAIDYVFVFTNNPGADPIDFVDVGLPNNSYNIRDITADVDGQPINDIEDSPYVTFGVALGSGCKRHPTRANRAGPYLRPPGQRSVLPGRDG